MLCSAKAYLLQYEGMAGKMGSGCRKPALKGVALAPHQREALAAMKRSQQRLCAELLGHLQIQDDAYVPQRIVEIDPATALPLDPHRLIDRPPAGA